MRRLLHSMLPALALLILAMPSAAQNRVLVRFHPSVNAAARTWATHRVNGLARRALGRLPVEIIDLARNADGDVAVRQLARSGRVLWAEVDRRIEPDGWLVPNDPLYPHEWHLPAINAPVAWDVTTGSATVTIAILDSGCDPTHPDLAPNYVAGWNFYDGNSNTGDVFGHGTAVAGCVGAAGNNGIGVAGVSWASKLMPIRVTDTSGYGYISTIANGISYAADHGCRAANVSFGTADASATVQTAADYAWARRCIVVVSSGNTGGASTTAPADHIIIAAATDAAGNRASFSTYGPFVDVAAPGVSVYSTNRGGGYGTHSGTSFSAPLTCGVLALEFSANPALSADQAVSILESTATDLGAAGRDDYYGYGLVNAAGAVQAALTLPPPPPPPPPPPADTTPPTCSITGPADGSQVIGNSLKVTVAASDNVGIASVVCTVSGDGSKTASGPTTFSFATKKWAKGAHTIIAYATDAAGNISQPVTITVYR